MGRWLVSFLKPRVSSLTFVTVPVSFDGYPSAFQEKRNPENPLPFVWEKIMRCQSRRNSGRFRGPYLGAFVLNVLVLSQNALAAPPVFEEQILVTSGQGGFHTYRIPAPGPLM